MFRILGSFTVKYPWLICLGWVLTGILLSRLAPNWDARSQDDDIRFLPDRCDSVQGYHALSAAFPQDVYASKAIIALERRDRKLTETDFEVVDRISRRLEELRQAEPGLQINKVLAYNDPFLGKRLVSNDGLCTLVQVSLATPFLAIQTQTTVDRIDAALKELLPNADSSGLHMHITGPAGIGRDLLQASGQGLDLTTIATVILVIVVLLFVYRSPLLALIPLVTIALSVWVALNLLALFTLIPGVYLVNVSKVFAIVLLYGAGTDYCLFLVSRYREELREGVSTGLALVESVSAVGGALAASAGTVICGLGMMAFAEFAKVRCAGPAIALSLAVALAASLTLTPALLRLLGKFAFWPVGLPKPSRASGVPAGRGWNWISRFVVQHPVLVWSLAMVILLPLAILGLRVESNYRPTGELAQACSSVQGLQSIQRHFTAGETGPITVLLTADTDWSTPAGRHLIDQLSRGFCKLENVAEVRSLTQPLGEPLEKIVSPFEVVQPEPAGKKSLFVSLNLHSIFDQANRLAKQHFVAKLPGESPRYVTRLDVVLHSEPFANASQTSLRTLQTWLREELPRAPHRMGSVQSDCYGITVSSRDLATITAQDRTRVNWLVLLGILSILLVLVRNPWLAIYLLGTVLLSYLSTLGATSLAGYLWTGKLLTEVDWRVPFFLFTILVAVGEDYNILLMTRALEEREKHGITKGLRLALAQTGGTITSCGLIMAGTFATLMFAGLGTLMQAGFALAFGVLLDTFLVRPFLVPAFTLILWRYQHGNEPEGDLVLPTSPRRRAA